MRDSGLSDITQTEIIKLQMDIQQKKNLLRRRQKDAISKKAKREKFKETLQKISAKDEEAGKMLKSFNRQALERPRVEVDQPELLSTILDIVETNSAADARRRCEILRTCTTLDDLCKELNSRGFNISRSATYLRLHPKRGNTNEGLRHVKTVPIKLLRPENTLRYEILILKYTLNLKYQVIGY